MKILCLSLALLMAGHLEASDGYHLVLRLVDDPNGPQWRQKLIADVASVSIPPAEIAEDLGLADGNLRLDFFTKTYGGTVKQVYESKVLQGAVGQRYRDLKWYLQNQDPQAKVLRLPLGHSGGWYVYPPEMNSFTQLQSVEIFDYYFPDQEDRVARAQGVNYQPFFMLFRTLPCLANVTSLRFPSMTSVVLTPGWSVGLQNIKVLHVMCDEDLVPEFYNLPNLEDLIVRFASQVPPGCSAWKKIKSLSLPFNKIRSLPDEFGSLVSLTALDISGQIADDSLTAPVADILARLTNLVSLNLGYKQYSEFPLKTGPGLWPCLASLSLDYIYSPTYPESIGDLTALTDLSINNYGLMPDFTLKLPSLRQLRAIFVWEKLARQIEGMTQLISLEFKLDTLYRINISGLTRLTELQTEYVNVSDHDQFCQLTALKRLFIKRTDYSQHDLPESITQLLGLTELKLNVDVRFPDTINRLTNLQKLECYQTAPCLTGSPYRWDSLRSLRFTEATLVPTDFGGLTNLEELILDRGQMHYLPRELISLTQLKRLHMTDFCNASLSQGMMEIIYCLDSLTELNVAGTSLAVISPNIKYLTRLEKLDLSVKDLTKIFPEIGTLTRLKELIFDVKRGGRNTAELPSSVSNLTNLLYLDVTSIQYPSGEILKPLLERGVWVE